LSLAAFQASEIDVVVAPVTTRPVGVDGGVVSSSAQAGVLVVNARTAERLPAASAASTPRVYVVLHARSFTVPVVPELVPTRVPFR
jgi:hypothetical protein